LTIANVRGVVLAILCGVSSWSAGSLRQPKSRGLTDAFAVVVAVFSAFLAGSKPDAAYEVLFGLGAAGAAWLS
jgi:hypothetical protein